MQKLIQNLWKLFLVSFPFSLHFVLYENASYRFGQFNPWVTGIIYLPELLLALIFVLWAISQFTQKTPASVVKKTSNATKVLAFLFWLLFVINAGVITFLQGDFNLFLFFAFKLFLAVIVCLLLQEELIPPHHTVRYLLYGAFLQVVVAGFQVYLNGSLGLAWLGESRLGPDLLNVAKKELVEGGRQIRGYGTFLHPNILGAYLVTVLFIALPYLKKFGRLFWPVFLVFGIYLTGSLAAQLTALILFGLVLLFKILRQSVQQKFVLFTAFFALILVNGWFFFNHGQITVEDTSVADRMSQNQISLDMFKDNLSGVGVHNFTLNMEFYAPQRLMPWEVQPVHNVYFLVLNEMGIQGLILLLLLILMALGAYFKRGDYNQDTAKMILPFFGLLILASFDHLLLTSYIGLLLIVLALCHVTSRT